MGTLLDCFRGENHSDQTTHSNSNHVITPDAETRRQRAAEAANQRLQQNERRGVDEDEWRRLKQRQSERERLEQEQAKLDRTNGDRESGGLRVCTYSHKSYVQRFDGDVNVMIISWMMGNMTNPLSLCVSQSSRKTREQRPYVSRPFWSYQYSQENSFLPVLPTTTNMREFRSRHLSSKIEHEMPPSRSIQIIRMN